MKKKQIACLFPLLLTIIAGIVMNADGLRAEELAPGLYKTRLDNGLTLLVRETPSIKAATVQIWVRAGSVYEEPHQAGITHFIEHMIFKGTPTRGPGELAGAIEAVGGSINAYTSFESTVYHATISSRHWAMALEVLADAVLHSTFDPEEVEREKKVVIEEVGMRNDRPNIKLFQELLGRAYTTHPYRLPVIGNVDSISNFSRESIRAYMQEHYQPENFVIVVVGDLRQAEVLAKVNSLMGDLPQGQGVTVPLPHEPPQKNLRHFVVEADIQQPQMALALPISAFSSPDTPVLDVIAHIIGHGETSRLYRSLRDKQQLVYGIEASSFTPHDPGLLEVFAVLDSEKILPALQAALTEVFTLKYLSVTAEELNRAKRNLESDFVFSLERVEGQARVLGSFEMMTGDPREDEYLEAIRSVTIEDIRRVADKYFRNDSITAGFLVPVGSAFSPTTEELEAIVQQADAAARQSDSPALLADAYLSGTHRFVLDNGITLLVREDELVETVAIRAVFPGGLRSETPATNGAFAFISELLPKGTESLTAQDIALKVGDMAGSLTGFNGKNTFGLKGDFLARFYKEGLNLTADILQHPAFASKEAEKIRPELLARLRQQEDSLPTLAFKEFNQLLFEGHPYGLNTAGSEEALTGLSVDALHDIYRQHARPDRLVLAVAGAVDAEDVRDQVANLFGGWRLDREPVTFTQDILPPLPLQTPKVLEIARDKEQVHLVIGFLGVALNDEDRYAMEILENVLSGQSGRLFVELRDKLSLAYSLSSFSLLGLDTGAFGIYLGTSPDKKQSAIAEIWKQLQAVREEKITDEELLRAKNILISQYEMNLQTHASQALEMALDETYGLGQDFGQHYIDAIGKVDADMVLAVARKYILPDRYVMVAVGARPAEHVQEP
jgi:zinc protease